MIDVFRPRQSPAAEIYDAFQEEARHRASRSLDEWIEAELNAVWRTACEQARQLGMIEPTMEQVQQAQITAMGHIDFGSKWALGVAEVITRKRQK